MKVTINGKEFYIEGFTKKNLDYVRERVLKGKYMAIFIIDGRTGIGKSTLAAQLAYYLSEGKFDLSKETFSSEQFAEVLKSCEILDAIVIDEAFALLNKRRVLSAQNIIMLTIMQQMRVKQVFCFIVLPCIYDLDKNIILNLADCFIHCYAKPFGRKGQYAIYDREGIKKLWLYGRLSYSYSYKIVRPNFHGRFTKFFPFNFKAYEKKKIEALESRREKEPAQKHMDRVLRQRNKLIKQLKKEGKSFKEIAESIDLQPDTIYRVLRE